MDKQKVNHRVVLQVPMGLEGACVGIARREYGVRFKRLSTGFLVSKEDSSDPQIVQIISEAPVWSFGSYRLAGVINEFTDKSLENTSLFLKEIVSALGLSNLKYWFDLRHVTDRECTKWAGKLLKRDIGIINDPTSYKLTLTLTSEKSKTYVLLGNSISVAKRFSYRKKDVKGSINPVLAACLVRLLPHKLNSVAIDPTCGSGTLLFERLKFSDESKGIGIDISPNAKDAFCTNLLELKLDEKSAEFILGDSMNKAHWEICSSVICNLPFGIQVKSSPEELQALYKKILDLSKEYLSEDGRILLISSYKSALESAEIKHKKYFKVLSKYRSDMGGLFYQIHVLGRV